ncbi:MAG: T9SS type A sorting domain-containing protein, partial [Bacteroidota bacterium]
NASVIDSLVVTFPSGQTIVKTNVTPNQFITITEVRPAGFFRGSLQIGGHDETAPALTQFYEISNTDASTPAISWKWDLNGDGVTDATTKTASFNYTGADTYSVSLIVSNGVKSDTVRSRRSVIIKPATAVIQFNTDIHNFGTVDVNVPKKDTTMYIYNRGKLTDSLSIGLIYGSSPVGTIKPDSAASCTPKKFTLAPNDSQAISFSIFPPKVVRTNLNITYTPKIVITSKNNDGAKVFEKTMWIKLQGTLLDVGSDVQQPAIFSLQQNYPNPFNPSTMIPFSIPTTSEVSLKIYDTIGREIGTVISGILSAGTYEKEWNAGDHSSGVYFIRLSAGGIVSNRKMVLTK